MQEKMTKKQPDAPLVSVVMPVYNTEKYVGEAIQSILDQTFTNFEFIIIDDGSTDRSWEIIQEYARKDERIRAHQNNWNQGISYTRNRLIDLTQTNYVASMDSDDISLPNRLQLCHGFLQLNLEYWVISGNNIIINEKWEKIWYRKYSDDIPNIILKKSPISQPSSMFRKDIFIKVWGYDNKIKSWLEDYDLWLRMYAKWYKIKNLSNTLLQYRIRDWQAKSKIKLVLRETTKIQKKWIKKYKIKPSITDMLYHIGEYVLLLFPSKTIMFLFSLIEYKWKKY